MSPRYSSAKKPTEQVMKDIRRADLLPKKVILPEVWLMSL